MLQMSLTQLQVYPNPFIDWPEPPPPPPSSGPRLFLRSSTASRTNLLANEHPVSEVTYLLPKIIPLVELSFRVLLSQPSKNSGGTLLEKHYDLPLDECPADASELPSISGKRRFIYPIPSHLRTVLELCAPYALYQEEEQCPNDASLLLTGIGVCPSSHHQNDIGKKPIFIRHAEERFSWVHTIGGVRVGGIVPIQWRGCQRGCLDFLEDNNGKTAQDVQPSNDTTPSTNTEVEDTLTMDEDAVQVIQFSSISGGAGLSFDD